MATHSSILAWKIPWTGEPGELQSMGSQKSWTPLKNNKKRQRVQGEGIKGAPRESCEYLGVEDHYVLPHGHVVQLRGH